MTKRATNHHRPYQGYPYVDPPVNDAPSISAEAAARWTNLPRRQVKLPVQRAEPGARVNSPDGAEASRYPGLIPGKTDPDPDPEPVVYIEMPEAGSQVSFERTPSNDEDLHPSTHREKRKSTDEPVLYIDIPETSGSGVSRSTPSEGPEEPEYVQDTIFYNPFENRRIEQKPETSQDSDSEDDSNISHSPMRPYPNIRPLPNIRPSDLDVYGAGSSGASSSGPASGSGLPPLMGKETMLYGAQNDGDFPTSPIPVSEFPEPPPAYAEIDLVSSPVVEQEPVVEQPRRVEEPPRTQVILPGSGEAAGPVTPVGAPNPDRKYLSCHHCGMRVHTLVVNETGFFTHLIALFFLLTGLLPCIALAYCTDWFKIMNHYCPSCNKVIGYEVPFGYNKMIYVN